VKLKNINTIGSTPKYIMAKIKNISDHCKIILKSNALHPFKVLKMIYKILMMIFLSKWFVQRH